MKVENIEILYDDSFQVGWYSRYRQGQVPQYMSLDAPAEASDGELLRDLAIKLHSRRREYDPQDVMIRRLEK